MLFYDTETCGFHGMCVLIQYAEDDGPIKLYNVWDEPVIDTLNLIEEFMRHDVCGFNLAYDHFHLSKLYTIFSLIGDCNSYPDPEEVALLEPKGRDGQCIKPKSACDIMLHARKGKYQSTMDRKDIRIRKIPNAIAWDLAEYLEQTIDIDGIYFANRKNKNSPRWAVYDREDTFEFKDIVLKFNASAALKNLAIHALGATDVLKYGDIEPDVYPVEVGYAPFALAISKGPDWKAKIKKASGFRRGYTWPAIIRHHMSHWYHNRLARKYAEDDVTYTRQLYQHLGSPEPGDNDSELACMVGSSRWRGYKIDPAKLLELKEKLIIESDAAPKAPNATRAYLLEVMTEDEKVLFDIIAEGSTKKVILEELAEGWDSEAGVRAQQVLNARQAKSELDTINKLLVAGRFHASFVIIGALSGRMSGRGGDLNSQGIKRKHDLRECFPLALSDMTLCGGDFDSFEVTIAIAYYNDKKLEEDVKSGKKIHALFGVNVYPELTYDDLLKEENKDKYTRAKSAVFAMIYGGEAYTLKTRLGVDLETAEKAFQLFIKQYPGIGRGRRKVFDMFCSMRQPNGIGTKVEWHEPEDFISTMFGFKRYFTLENKICKALYTLARKPPAKWKQYKGKVVRTDREQGILGACSSALYAAAFGLQAANMRAAGNHVIQGSGAEITKEVQRKIWDLQPCGVHKFIVQPMNVHDELMNPTNEKYINQVKEIVDTVVSGFTETVPLLSIDWDNNMSSWADK